MKPFKVSYKVVRHNSDEIYKGFGFRHLSDVTQYYVHPDNQSFKGTTTLCQPIGEALLLFAGMLEGCMKGEGFGDYYVSEDRRTVRLEITVPGDYHFQEVIEENIHSYRAVSEDGEVRIAAYDKSGRWIDGNMEHLRPLYKLLPTFCVLLAREMEEQPEYRNMITEFIENPFVDLFVNLHEDFYQMHKNEEYEISYTDIPESDKDGYRSFSESYEVIWSNEESIKCIRAEEVKAFGEEIFSPEWKQWIPQLPPEFVLPENLKSICNAVVSGDLRAVLFHGPAGTGKTMSCKLMAREIRLPILETINCTENLDEFVLGKFIPEDDRIVFRESYVTKAIREGGAVVFEEINFAKPQHLAFLNSLLDDNGFVRLDDGRAVRRNPNFRFFATMNLGYFGTKELNQALYNRFNGIIEIAALSDEAIFRMLLTRVPECEAVADKILAVYHKIKKKIEAEELDIVISPRNLENWARLAKYEGYIHAAEKTIIPIAKCDRVLENTFRSIIFLYKWS